MQPQAKEFYREAFDYSMSLQEQLPTLQSMLQQQQPIEESADLHYAISRAFDVVEDTLKHLRQLKTLSEKLVCLKWALLPSGDNIKTDYVTATPKVVEMPKIPSQKSDPEGYKKLLQYFNCPEELLDKDLLRVHWPSLSLLVEEHAAEGKPLPPGCDPSTTYPIYSVRQLKRKGVLEE